MTPHVENTRRRKLEIQGVGSLVGTVSARPERRKLVLGAAVGASIPHSDVEIKPFSEPFPAPVCQTPFHRGCWSSFPVNAALVTASLASAQEIKAINEQ